MTITFEPMALSEVDCVCLILDYILEEDSTMRSLAEDYCIGKTTVHKYLHQAHIYDNKLDDIVQRKAKSKYWGRNLPKFRRRIPIKSKPFKLKVGLHDHLLSKYRKLRGMTELPPNLGTFLWGDYNKTSK